MEVEAEEALKELGANFMVVEVSWLEHPKVAPSDPSSSVDSYFVVKPSCYLLMEVP